ncbi:MAG TPA: bifunctional UDP-N-acetylglucosamine diphosphorylase/glucosamine-1-phosphate N-acetyltransferase GlmU [Nitrospiria bacterium]|nr:bifunctional UDP-N-acetylglucosamine diphosphorylase/glucosamine-1-phosphate N-acetyltransferase GlmU [Nitrospiria bacterium]
MKPVSAVVLAAGLGTRMKSTLAKILHPLCGRPMILHLLDRLNNLSLDKIVLVAGHQREKVSETVFGAYPDVKIAFQEKQSGTGHAVLQAEPVIGGKKSDLLILNGDVPLISEDILSGLILKHRKSGAALSLVTAELENPAGYGRIVRNRAKQIVKIVEEKDASPVQKKIREINAGIYLADSGLVFEGLKKIKPQNAQGEYYLTDIVGYCLSKKKKVNTVKVEQTAEIMGINHRGELARAEKLLRRRICEKWMAEGVTLIDPDLVFIEERVTIGPDTVLHPGVTLRGSSSIGKNSVIHTGSVISNSRLEEGVEVKAYSVIEGAHLGEGASVGPFAHLRPGSEIGKNARIGNFVEIKKSVIGEGSKAGHLSYLGDTVLGKNVNVGAGTITCNFDGFEKHQTLIGDDVFIGSDTQFIAPVRVESGSVIGAGSTIVNDVPKDSLALSRSPQIIKEGWAARNRLKGKPPKKRGA